MIECVICFENFDLDVIKKTNCEHYFCIECITQYKISKNYKEKGRCPYCRQIIDFNNMNISSPCFISSYEIYLKSQEELKNSIFKSMTIIWK